MRQRLERAFFLMAVVAVVVASQWVSLRPASVVVASQRAHETLTAQALKNRLRRAYRFVQQRARGRC